MSRPPSRGPRDRKVVSINEWQKITGKKLPVEKPRQIRLVWLWTVVALVAAALTYLNSGPSRPPADTAAEPSRDR